MLVVLKLLHKIDAICRPSMDVVGFLKIANLRRRRYIKLIHAVYNLQWVSDVLAEHTVYELCVEKYSVTYGPSA